MAKRGRPLGSKNKPKECWQDFYDTAALAHRYDVSAATIRRWNIDGKLPKADPKFGWLRWPKQQVHAWEDVVA